MYKYGKVCFAVLSDGKGHATSRHLPHFQEKPGRYCGLEFLILGMGNILKVGSGVLNYRLGQRTEGKKKQWLCCW